MSRLRGARPGAVALAAVAILTATGTLAACAGGNQHVALRDACEARYGVGNCVQRHSSWVPLASATTTTPTSMPPGESTSRPPPSSTSRPPPSSTSGPTSSPPQSSLAPSSTVPPASGTSLPPVNGLAELALVGMWSHHGFSVTIRADGSGEATWRIYRWCSENPAPPCDQLIGNQIIDGGRAAFTMSARPQSSVAVARITSSTDATTLGAPGTVQVSPVLGRSGPGEEIIFPIRSDPNFVLCDNAAEASGDCGA